MTESFDQIDIRGLAAEAVASLSHENKRKPLLRELLTSDDTRRASAARIVERFVEPAHVDLLFGLSKDSNPAVREAAASALSLLIAKNQADSSVIDHVTKLLEQSGRRMAVAIVSRLLQEEKQNSAVERILITASSHPSARVRRAIEQSRAD